jgi:hypothetical protein
MHAIITGHCSTATFLELWGVYLYVILMTFMTYADTLEQAKESVKRTNRPHPAGNHKTYSPDSGCSGSILHYLFCDFFRDSAYILSN